MTLVEFDYRHVQCWLVDASVVFSSNLCLKAHLRFDLKPEVEPVKLAAFRCEYFWTGQFDAFLDWWQRN